MAGFISLMMESLPLMVDSYGFCCYVICVILSIRPPYDFNIPRLIGDKYDQVLCEVKKLGFLIK